MKPTRNSLLAVIVLLMMISCNLPFRSSTPGYLAEAGHEAVGAIHDLDRDSIPEYLLQENPVRTGAEFDPNEYFGVLAHLSMEPGYSLDYIYVFDGLGGYPVLYARPFDQEPFQTAADLFTVYPDGPDSYLNRIIVDDTEKGYLQLAVLSIIGQQFYLDWHANYNDTRPVFTREDIGDLFSEIENRFGSDLASLKRQAAQLDLEPKVSILIETVQVEFITFTKWGGFYRETFTIQREFPHTIEVDTENLIEYDCGIMF